MARPAAPAVVVGQGTQWMRALTPYVWVLPAFVIYGVFKLAPMIGGFWLALLRWDGITPARYIGARNFQRLLEDEILRRALLNNVQYAVGTVAGKMALSLLLALLLNQAIAGRGFYRTVLFMPVVMSFVVVGILWSWMYNDQFGLVNNLLRMLGLGVLAQNWLGDTRVALWSLILVDIWKWYGFHMVIFLAGLQTIPTELYEAARIDGASRLRQLTSITLPLLQPVLLVNILVSLIGAFNVFDIPYIMTQGGPANSTNVIALHIYLQAFKFNNLGYGAALSYALIALIALIALPLLKRSASAGLDA